MKCKVFKIPLQNGEFDESKLNEILANVEVKQVFASVVNDIENFWSVMVFYEEAGAISKSNKNVSAQSSPLGGKSYSIPASAIIPTKPIIEEPAALAPEQEKFFDALKVWRNERAKLEGLPAYVVAHDELLMQIAAAPVKTPEDLMKMKDFGYKRTQIYGDEIVKILSSNA
ncbi:MAG: HRDC domain-containing protein [Pyrinomonadaceae bacterium]